MNEEKFIRTYNEEKFCDAKCDGLDTDIEKTRSSYFAPLGSFLNTMSNMSLDSYCKMVCRGRACKNCSPDQFLSDPSSPLHSSPLLGLNASWITDNILATSRPTTRIIKEFDIIKQCKKIGITAILNMEEPGEHAFCGDDLDISGFSYNPREFMDNNSTNLFLRFLPIWYSSTFEGAHIIVSGLMLVVYFLNFPVHDFCAPSLQQMLDIAKVMENLLSPAGVHPSFASPGTQNSDFPDSEPASQNGPLKTHTVEGSSASPSSGGKLIVHCHGGYGRTGCAIAAYLVFSTRRHPNFIIDYMREKRKSMVQMREQIDIIVQFAEMLKPLRIVFIESKADSRSLTLNQYLNYQRKLLHGREAQLFKYIPKVVYICCARLVELTGGSLLFSESGQTRRFSSREAASLNASPKLPDEESTDGNVASNRRHQSEVSNSCEARAGVTAEAEAVDVPPLAIEPRTARSEITLDQLVDAFAHEAALACRSATAAFTPRTPANALLFAARARQNDEPSRQRRAATDHEVEQRVLSHVQALNEGSNEAIRALLAETSHEVLVSLLALWLTQFQNPIIQYQDYTLLVGVKQPKLEITAIEAIKCLEKGQLQILKLLACFVRSLGAPDSEPCMRLEQAILALLTQCTAFLRAPAALLRGLSCTSTTSSTSFANSFAPASTDGAKRSASTASSPLTLKASFARSMPAAPLPAECESSAGVGGGGGPAVEGGGLHLSRSTSSLLAPPSAHSSGLLAGHSVRERERPRHRDAVVEFSVFTPNTCRRLLRLFQSLCKHALELPLFKTF